ncbi:MAG: sugar transferase [Candidatus Omnitrophica bacterium]|nr:sugar transferase [Candidatus Omnitrophota bacterium]
MLREKEAVVRRAMVLFDGFIVSITFVLAYIIRKYFHAFYKLDLIPSAKVVTPGAASINDYLVVLVIAVMLWCAMLYWNGMYRSMRTKTLLEIVWIIIKSTFLTTLAFGTIVFLFKLHFVSRVFFGIFIVVSASTILIEKITIFSLIHAARKRGHNFRRLLVVGTGRRASQFIDKIKSHPEWGLKILGVVNDEPGRDIKEIEDNELLGNIDDISQILHRRAVDEVVFVVPRARLNHIEEAVYACETEGVKATLAIDLFELKIAKSHLTEIDGIPLLTFETTFAREWQLFIKRAIDIVVSGAGIVILGPILLTVMILIRLTSKGPAFFIQKRVGLNGRKFVLYKFRTMYKGAHKKLSEIESLNEMGGPIFKIKNDPRITPLGRFLRKFSIDEMPQLFNVLLGHMGLVGPRPPLPKEVALYKTWQRRRLSMRPGLTCLWQISGRNKIDFNEWMKLDLEYLDNWSLWLDFKILIKTIPVVLFGIGAY